MINLFSSVSKISKIILFSLENERTIDLSLYELIKNNDSYIPSFKVLKLISYNFVPKVPFLIWLLVVPVVAIIYHLAALLFVPVIFVIIIFRSFLFIRPMPDCFIFPTSNDAKSLIHRALSFCSIGFKKYSYIKYSVVWLSLLLSPLYFIKAVLVYFLVLYKIFFTTRFSIKIDLILHSYDLGKLCLLSVFVEGFQGTIASDDHYQRWSFLFSHLSNRFVLVQHGYVNSDITFPHKYGKVTELCIRSKVYKSHFSKYYDLRGVVVFNRNKNISREYSNLDIVLVSSFPYIDQELEFLRALRKKFSCKVAIKLHPSHRYDYRGELLIALADVEIKDDSIHLCKLFVSHNSFMQVDYKEHRIDCFSLSSASNLDLCFEKIDKLLKF